MGAVTDHGAFCGEKADKKSSALMLDVKFINPLDPTAPARAGTRAGYALEEAVSKAKDAKYGGTYQPTCEKLLP